MRYIHILCKNTCAWRHIHDKLSEWIIRILMVSLHRRGINTKKQRPDENGIESNVRYKACKLLDLDGLVLGGSNCLNISYFYLRISIVFALVYSAAWQM